MNEHCLAADRLLAVVRDLKQDLSSTGCCGEALLRRRMHCMVAARECESILRDRGIDPSRLARCFSVPDVEYIEAAIQYYCRYLVSLPLRLNGRDCLSQ